MATQFRLTSLKRQFLVFPCASNRPERMRTSISSEITAPPSSPLGKSPPIASATLAMTMATFVQRLACDIMEAVRPSVDAWLLDWINRDGTFQAPVNYPRLPIGTNIAVGDFNGDHKLDVARGGYVGGALLGGRVDVLLNSGVVSLFPPTPISFNAQFIGSGSPQQNIT